MAEWVIRDRRIPEHVMHPSTGGALALMRKLAEYQNPSTILDMGCGSGILSMVAAEIWPNAAITAVDIAPEAVEDATANISEHGFDKRIRVLRSDGFTNPEIAENGPYDLIICNLIAKLIVSLSAELRKNLKTEGCVILSGILAWRYPTVMEAQNAVGMEVAGEIRQAEWLSSLFVPVPETQGN